MDSRRRNGRAATAPLPAGSEPTGGWPAAGVVHRRLPAPANDNRRALIARIVFLSLRVLAIAAVAVTGVLLYLG